MRRYAGSFAGSADSGARRTGFRAEGEQRFENPGCHAPFVLTQEKTGKWNPARPILFESFPERPGAIAALA